MKKVSQETADQVFRDWDINKDNRVSLREFRTMIDIGNSHAKEICPKCPGKLKSKTPKGPETSKEKGTTKLAFRRLDLNNDGYLSRDEIGQVRMNLS